MNNIQNEIAILKAYEPTVTQGVLLDDIFFEQIQSPFYGTSNPDTRDLGLAIAHYRLHSLETLTNLKTDAFSKLSPQYNNEKFKYMRTARSAALDAVIKVYPNFEERLKTYVTNCFYSSL